MSYKPAQSGVPNGIVYFGNAASDNVFEAESAFAYNPSTNTLNVDNVTVDVDASVGGNLSVTGSGSFDGDLTVLGDLNVSGVVNQINLQELLIEDNKIVLNSNLTGAPSDDIDGEIIINRGTSPDVKIIYNEGQNKDIWEFTNDGSTYHPFFIAGSGISSDGKLDICDLPVETTGDDSDYIAICDASDSNITKKITRSNLLSGLGAMSQWYLEDEDGTETTIQNNTEVKFVGSGVTINWDTGDGSDSTPYRLEFDVNVDNSTVGINGSDQVYVKDGGIGTTQLADGAVTEAKVTRTITEVSANSTISNDVTLVTTGATDKTVTLPTAVEGKVVVIKKKDSGAGNVVVVGATHDSVTDTIDDASSKRLYYIYESITCIAKTTGTASDQQAWYII